MGGCPTGTAPGSFPRGGRKRGLQTDLQNEIVQEIEDLLARQSIADLDLEALEMAARCQALRWAARALKQRLNTDTSYYVGPELPCPCGGVARYHGRHGKTFESVLGPLHLKRAYYDCGRCHQGFCPRDRALKLESFSLTPGVLRMTASAAALMSFEDRKSTRLNSSHGYISYAVFCLKKKKNTQDHASRNAGASAAPAAAGTDARGYAMGESVVPGVVSRSGLWVVWVNSRMRYRRRES